MDDAAGGFDGTGTVEGTARDLVIRWNEGTLRAEVEPGTGTGLQVGGAYRITSSIPVTRPMSPLKTSLS